MELGNIKLEITDLLSIIIIICCFILIAFGIDKTVALILTMVVSFYYGKKTSNKK